MTKTAPMTPERLRELYGAPSTLAANKTITAFDKHCRDFIVHSTFLVLATTNGDNLDVSPKGDPAGFVQIEDDQHLLLPDRPGNNLIDGMMNLLQNPNVSLIFFIPGVAETLRVSGTAEIIDDPDICSRFAIKGRSPKTVLRIKANRILLHCGKAMVRAGLWKPATWPQSRPVPALFEMARDHAGMEIRSASQKDVEEAYEKTLY